MAKTKQLPSGRWNVQITCGKDENGKQIRISCTADTKKEAELLAAKKRSEAKHEASDRAHNRIKLKRAMEEYIESCRITGASPSTLRGYDSIMRNIGDFGNILVCDIDTRTLQRMVNAWVKMGNSSKTVRNKLFFVTATIESFDIWPQIRAIKLPKTEKVEMVIPQSEDVQRLLSACKQDRNLYIAVLLASTLGMRRSEICALDWQDVDFTKQTVNIDKAKVMGDDGCLHVKGTKTRSGTRTLPIHESVLNELRPYRQLSGPVLTVPPHIISDRYIKAAKKYGIPGRFHDLRHYVCSVMAALGVSELYSVKYMGHSTNDSVHQAYEHTLRSKETQVNSTLSEYMARLVNGEDVAF